MLSLLVASDNYRLRSIWSCTCGMRISLLINQHSYFLLYYFLADREPGTFYSAILIHSHPCTQGIVLLRFSIEPPIHTANSLTSGIQLYDREVATLYINLLVA